MRKVSLSLIITVFNEQNTISRFIESVLNQSKLPDEFIIVDGGSTDMTVAKIRSSNIEIRNKRIKFEIIVKKGNRAVGRNEAIRNANGEIILCSDSGCILDKNWIKNIIKPFEDNSVDVVAGYYKGKPKNVFQKCLIPYVLVMLDKVDENNFLPATRSMAFKKSIWKKVGGFPEEFSHNEDHIFANKLKKIGAKIAFQKDAIVNWIPRKNLRQAFIMFYRFALGDSESGILREKVVLIFARYALGFYLFLLAFIERSFIPLVGVILGIFLYILWSIKKHYRYIKDTKALFFLPLLQFVSDFAVILGTTLGLLKRMKFSSVIRILKANKSTSIFIGIYIFLMLMLINKGIPNIHHPFTYFMDEWHQAQAVRTVYAQGSPNVPGSANGSMFHFLLIGLWLVPFIVTGIVNPFAIKSSVEAFEMQQKLFQVLRLNTLFFGILSIILIVYIAKKYFKFNPFWTTFLFVVNPIFLTLSNYFKYDVALIFWIILSFLFFLKYSLTPNSINFFLGAFFSGIALSVKISAIPLLPILISAFLLFNISRKKHFGQLIGGIFIFFCTFLLLGIPDLLLGKGNITEYLYDNLIRTPSYTQNYILGMPYWAYLIIKGAPSVFGTVLSLISLFGFVFVVINIFKKRLIDSRRNLYVLTLMAIIFFILSLVPLQIEARGNRLLVLFPFMALLGGLFLEKVLKIYSNISRKILMVIFVFFLLFQTSESLSWLYIKLQIDPRQKSSEWIINNIPPKSVIGIENIPIYQFLPDIVNKEFYVKQHSSDKTMNFKYKIVDNLSIKDLPTYVIITNEKTGTDYLKYSPKKSLISKLRMGGYRKIFVATPDFSVLKLFRDERDYFMSGLIQAPVSISIYKKPQE